MNSEIYYEVRIDGNKLPRQYATVEDAMDAARRRFDTDKSAEEAKFYRVAYIGINMYNNGNGKEGE